MKHACVFASGVGGEERLERERGQDGNCQLPTVSRVIKGYQLKGILK